MKKAAIFILALLLAVAAFAKKNPDDYRIIAIMADGSRVEGYITTGLDNHFHPKITTVGISTEFEGEEKKYTSEEVKAIIFPPTPSDTVPVIYESVKAQKSISNYLKKNPKPYKEPVFLRLIYAGDNVKGYVMPLRDATYTPSMTVVTYTYRYFYKRNDDDVAKAYWDDTNGIIPSMKKVMKFYFREFPALQEMVDKKELKPSEFRDNPAMVLPLMDAFSAPTD